MLVLLILWMCTSCADSGTKYQPSGFAGGYNSKKLEDNTYRVWFLYNGFTELSTVKNYLLYRCAEITVENEKLYFVIESEKLTRIPLKLEYVITISDTMFDENEHGFDSQKVIDEFGYGVKDTPSEPPKNKWSIWIWAIFIVFILIYSSLLNPPMEGIQSSPLSTSEHPDNIRALCGKLTYCLEIGDVAGRVRVCRVALKILEAKPRRDPETKKDFQENLAIPLLMKPFGRANDIDEAITSVTAILA